MALAENMTLKCRPNQFNIFLLLKKNTHGIRSSLPEELLLLLMESMYPFLMAIAFKVTALPHYHTFCRDVNRGAASGMSYRTSLWCQSMDQRGISQDAETRLGN